MVGGWWAERWFGGWCGQARAPRSCLGPLDIGPPDLRIAPSVSWSVYLETAEPIDWNSTMKVCAMISHRVAYTLYRLYGGVGKISPPQSDAGCVRESRVRDGAAIWPNPRGRGGVRRRAGEQSRGARWAHVDVVTFLATFASHKLTSNVVPCRDICLKTINPGGDISRCRAHRNTVSFYWYS